jgi:hypothetical protein
LKNKLIVLLLLLIGCAQSETIFDPQSFLSSKKWTSYKYVFNDTEYPEFLIKDYYLKNIPGTVIEPGDSLMITLVFDLTFSENNKLDFHRVRKRYIKCFNCPDFVSYDQSEGINHLNYYAKDKFIVLADSTGYNPSYYEISYLSDHEIRINRYLTMKDNYIEKDRFFNGIQLTEYKTYYLDFFLRSDIPEK